MIKKILLTTLTTLSIITPFAHAGERMAKDDVERVEIHKECFMHPVLVDKDIKESSYTHEVYEINAYYDGITGYRINLDYEKDCLFKGLKLRGYNEESIKLLFK